MCLLYFDIEVVVCWFSCWQIILLRKLMIALELIFFLSHFWWSFSILLSTEYWGQMFTSIIARVNWNTLHIFPSSHLHKTCAKSSFICEMELYFVIVAIISLMPAKEKRLKNVFVFYPRRWYEIIYTLDASEFPDWIPALAECQAFDYKRLNCMIYLSQKLDKKNRIQNKWQSYIPFISKCKPVSTVSRVLSKFGVIILNLVCGQRVA